ncbi:MAG: DsbC family protein [Desulfuromonadales bacterium]|nr:DsbC family protein [Desulfuromonadales bacterium]
MIRVILVFLLFLIVSVPAYAMGQEGCGAGTCNSCHSMTLDEAKAMFPRAEKVLSVDFSELPGLFVVELEGKGKREPVYVDFSKKYIVAGNIFRLADNKNISESRRTPEATEVDLKKVPVDDALLVGKADARYKVIVFTDPDCPYCRKLHTEMKQVIKTDPDIAFQVMLFPLPMHKDAYAKSKSILCSRSSALLDLAFSGAPIPLDSCVTDSVDKNIRLANELGIRGTPALIFPDGHLTAGFLKADDIIAAVRNAKK